MAKTIRQSVTVKASPKVVYAALMDSKTHARFTEAKAVVSRRVGGSFTAYDGYASGKNLELVPGEENRSDVARQRLAEGCVFQTDGPAAENRLEHASDLHAVRNPRPPLCGHQERLDRVLLETDERDAGALMPSHVIPTTLSSPPPACAASAG